MPSSNSSIGANFDSNYIKDINTGCWIWQRAISSSGYGYFRVSSTKTIRVHRYAYERKFGTIAKELHVDHLCRNKLCCNPEHLEAVSETENIRRGKAAKITLDIANKIREQHKTGKYRHIDLARFHGLGKSTIGFILANKTWKADSNAITKAQD